jgi:hypothetical protein
MPVLHPDGRVRFEASVPVPAVLLAEARRYRDDVARLISGAAALEAFPANLCPPCSGGLRVRQSICPVVPARGVASAAIRCLRTFGLMHRRRWLSVRHHTVP